MLTQLLALSRTIRRLTEEHRPTHYFALHRVFDHLSPSDLELMDAIEKRFGEDRANRWLCTVLCGTSLFVRDDRDRITSTAALT